MENKLDLGKDKISKLLLTFAIPCVISMLINSIYNIVDQIFIGHKIGYLGNGATNIIFPLVVISLAFSLLIGDGAGAFLSLNLGEKDYKEAKNGVGSAITLLSIITIILALTFSIFLSNFINLFGCTKEIYPYALNYGRIIVLGLPFSMMSTAITSIIRADGNPKYSMISLVSGALINIILDPIFIYIFNMGVTGAAIATVIGQLVSFTICIRYLFHFKNFKLELNDFKIDKSIKKVLSYGLSSFITQLTIVVVVITMNNLLKTTGKNSIYGANIPLTVFGIVQKVNSIFISIIVGISVGAQPIIGFNYGAKEFKRVKETFITTIKVCLIVGLIVTIAFQVFPKQITNIFGSESALYIKFSIKCFRIFLMMALLNAFQIASGIFFQALGKAKKSAFCSLSRQILLFLPSALILSKIAGLEGLLYAAPIADTLAFLITLALFINEYKHLSENRKAIDL